MRPAAFGKSIVIGIITLFVAVFAVPGSSLADLDSSLVGYWSFDEGSGDIAYDYSGNGNDGIIYGATWTTGASGAALKFDGEDDYVNCGNNEIFEMEYGVTLVACIYKEPGGGKQGQGGDGIIATDRSPGVYSGHPLGLGSLSNNHYPINISSGDGRGGGYPHYRRSKVSPAIIEHNKWYHVVGVIRGPTDMSIYVDGVDVGGSYSGSGGDVAWLGGPCVLGVTRYWEYYFKGIIDEVRIYDRALSEAEIESLYYQCQLSDSLIMLDGHGAPSSSGNLVDIELVNTVPVAGIQFTLTDIPNWLIATGGNTTARTPGFTVGIADDGSSVTALVFQPEGNLIPVGSGPVLQLLYDVDAGAPAGGHVTMNLHDVVVSDEYAQPIAVVAEDGVFALDLKGDVNGDGNRNILDIIRIVNIILGNPPPPTPYELWVADCDCDGNINILDITLLMNCILSGDCDFCSEKLAKISTEPARIGVDRVIYPAIDQLTVHIGIETPVPVAGVQLTLEYDPHRLVPDEVQGTELTDDFTVASRVESGKLTLLLYSTTGQLIPAVSGPIVHIPFKLRSKKTSCGELHFEEVILAAENGGIIPVVTKDAVLSAAAPESYGLSQNYPNPFNPVTLIKYDLPTDCQVKLDVYSILGQEVATLVDGKQKTGYKTARWDASAFSSGIYFYRLQAGDFVQTRKMVLLK